MRKSAKKRNETRHTLAARQQTTERKQNRQIGERDTGAKRPKQPSSIRDFVHLHPDGEQMAEQEDKKDHARSARRRGFFFLQKEKSMQQEADKSRAVKEKNSISAFLNRDREPETEEGTSKQQRRRQQQKKQVQRSDLPPLKSYVKLEVEGFNQSRLLNALMQEGVPLGKISKHSQKVMCLSVAKKYSKKTFALLDKMCYTYRVVAVSGTVPIGKYLWKRIGIVAGAAMFTVVAVFSSTFIWRIEIEGNDKVDEWTIISQLKTAGIQVGKKKQFDRFDAQQLLNSMDNILESTVEVVGTTVKIKVTETTDYQQPDPDRTPCDIVSKYDSEITRVVVINGTGKVNIGDRIAAGSVLISRDVLNTNGEVMGQTRARGEVYGKVIFSESALISTWKETSVRTGKKMRMTSLKLWGINIKAKNKNKFVTYETVTKQMYAFDNTFLPIQVKQTIFYETKHSVEEVPIETLMQAYQKERLLQLVIKAGGSPIETIVTKEEVSDGLYRVHLYAVAEMLISKEVYD